MKLTKEMKDELRGEYRKVYPNSEKMVEHCVNKASAVMELRGRKVVFEKPHIQTNFWFGEHGFDYDEVTETCRRLSRNEQYFIDENLRNSEAGWCLGQLEKGCFPNVPTFRENDRNGLASITWVHWDQVEQNDPSVLTAEETRNLELALEDEQAKFLKRLQSYLKRYGLTKCRFSTYWADR